MNAEKLKDPRVRQAIQYAYDGDAVLQGSYDGLTGRSAGVVQPGTQFAREKNKIATRDIEKAKALLKEAGVTNPSFTLMTPTTSDAQRIAQVVQAMAKEAGFVLAAASEINANPKDTKDHPFGVWTLPPVMRGAKEEDKARLQAIGETDRMTLLFRKRK